MKKRCGYCKKYKNSANFNKDKQTNTGLANRCRQCASIIAKKQHIERRQDPERWKGILSSRNNWRCNNIVRNLVNEARLRARKKGVIFDLDYKKISLPEYCPVLGIKIERGIRKGGKYNSPSIDRLKNEIGYTQDNIRIISWRANTLKKDATIQELELILKYMKGE